MLATLYRYMTSGTEPTRERVLLAGVEGDEHTLGLQMVHDQLAAAGFQTVFDTDLSAERLLAMVDSQSPDADRARRHRSRATREPVEVALRDLRSSHPEHPDRARRARGRRQPARASARACACSSASTSRWRRSRICSRRAASAASV